MSELELNSELTSNDLEQKNSTSTIKFRQSGFFKGLEIYIQGFYLWHVWLHMAASEIKRRYKRTFLGPFWVTLSLMIFIGSMGLVFPILWHIDVKTYIPFFASGFIIWSFIAACITDACGTFLDVTGLIKQVSLPYTVYSNTVVARNFFILLHHFAFYVFLAFLFHVPINFNTLLIIPALIILCFTASWVSILLGLLVARFRDIKQIVTSLLQITLFVTPVFWMPNQLSLSWQYKVLVVVNPLFHFVSIAREPLLGHQPSEMNWLISLSFCMLGWIVTMRVLSKYYRHLVFWL